MIKAFSTTANVHSRRGFTLLELIAVMGIIVALSLVIVGGYSGMIRTISEKAGVNALRRGAMLARQHATIDGRDTYFFLTGWDTYILCRRAGTISARETRPLSGKERPIYMPPGQYGNVIWIYDQYSDLSSAMEFEDENALTKEQQDEIKEGEYAGALIFDLKEKELSVIRYPPWYEYQTDRWVMGIDKKAKEFDAGNVYGWAVYPEQKLPKGYAFVKSKDNFLEEGSFYFKPDGTAESDDNMLNISIQELSSGKLSTMKIQQNGTVEIDD